jgi:hypothetical protein
MISKRANRGALDALVTRVSQEERGRRSEKWGFDLRGDRADLDAQGFLIVEECRDKEVAGGHSGGLLASLLEREHRFVPSILKQQTFRM